MSTSIKYASYALTVRPRGGLSPATEARVVDWLLKQDYYFACVEMEDECRHLHAQIWLNVPRARGEVCTSLTRIGEATIKEWDEPQKKVMRQGVRCVYSDWYLDYLQECEMKPEACKILCQNVPDITHKFYPTEEEQQKLKDKTNAVDKEFFELEQMYWARNEAGSEVTRKSVQAFFANAYYGERVLVAPRCSKRLGDKVKFFINYLKKDVSWQACASKAEILEDAERILREEAFNRSCIEARSSDN